MRQNRVGVQKLFRRFGHFSLIVTLSFSVLSAQQSFKDFKKSQTETFKAYKDERDSAFSNYLKQEYKEYILEESKALYEKQKPITIEPAKPKEIKPVGPKISIKIRADEKKEEEVIAVPLKQAVWTPSEKKSKDISFDFYGLNVGFDLADGIKKANFYPTNQTGITNFFDSAASSDYEPLLLDIQKLSKTMNLNDWGIYLLVSKISDNTYENRDNAKLLSWFLLSKLGYDLKVGLDKKHIVLMHHSLKTIYAAPSCSFGEKKYYVLSDYAKNDNGRVFSYKQDYPGSTKPLNLSLDTLPVLKENFESKVLTFFHFEKRYDIPLSYNKNLIDFMASYPQADYETFFNAPLETKTYKDLAVTIKKYIDGKKASEAMNFVLSFVQKSFKYEQDNKQFGKEKVMFAQETLYFEKSDCEDRAVLFSYLIKELFDVSVIGVKYEDHMATALYIPLDGEKVKSGSREFVIADPTYINAIIGETMPKYRSIQPQSYIIVKGRM